MKFNSELIQGRFLKRYKRFFADVELNGEVVVSHLPNTGSLKSCGDSGSLCLMSPAENPERKLKYTLEAINAHGTWVGVNTSWPNKLAVEVFKQRLLPHWHKYDEFQQEVKINDQSRMDMALWSSKDSPVKKWKVTDFNESRPIHFVEVKNVTLKVGSAVQFPDAVTERGQKHIEELVQLMARGYSAEMLFIVQRSDVEYFEAAKDIDPVYAQRLKEAADKGLKITALAFAVDPSGITFARSLPLKI